MRYQVATGRDAETWSTHRKLSAARKEAEKQAAKGSKKVTIWKLTEAEYRDDAPGECIETY